MISVIVPTIDGREEHLERCLAGYEQRTQHSFEIIVEKNHSQCGSAWNAGAAKAQGEYVHFTADDLEPLSGWDNSALRLVRKHYLPAPRVLNPDMSLDSCGGDGHEDLPEGAPATFTRIPFLDRQMLEAVLPIPEVHYYTDYFVSAKARQFSYETRVARGYCFIHHWAGQGRLNSYQADLDFCKRRLS